MEDSNWKAANGVREGEDNVINSDFDLLVKTKNYISSLGSGSFEVDGEEKTKEELKNELIDSIEKSSYLSISYTLDYIKEAKNKYPEVEDIEKLIIQKLKRNESSEVQIYDPALGDFVREDGESRKGRL